MLSVCSTGPGVAKLFLLDTIPNSRRVVYFDGILIGYAVEKGDDTFLCLTDWKRKVTRHLSPGRFLGDGIILGEIHVSHIHHFPLTLDIPPRLLERVPALP